MKGFLYMNELINWLFKTTQDGATYLQVIILGIIFAFTLCGLCITLKDSINLLKEGDVDNEDNAQDM